MKRVNLTEWEFLKRQSAAHLEDPSWLNGQYSTHPAATMKGLPMRAIVVYESIWGNTEKIARAISDALEPTMSVEVVASHVAPTSLDEFDMVFVGGPTHAFSMSRPSTREQAAASHGADGVSLRGIREWIETVRSVSGVPAVCFDTRVDTPHLPGSAAKAARRELRAQGFNVETRPMSFHVHGYEGPLVDGEIERAGEWARGIAASLTAEALKGVAAHTTPRP